MSKKLTMREVMQALLNGKKLAKREWIGDVYIKLDGDKIVNQCDDIYTGIIFNEDYIVYEPPKQKKKVTLYRYTHKELVGEHMYQTGWVSYGPAFPDHTLLKTETKEVEYEEPGDE